MKKINARACPPGEMLSSVPTLALAGPAWADGAEAGVAFLDQNLILGGLLLVLLGILLWLFVRNLVMPANRRQGHTARTPVRSPSPRRLAQLRFKLDDPLDAQAFHTFLDQVLLIAGDGQTPGYYRTPLQVIEEAVLRAVREIEERHQGKVTVEVKFSRSSLTLGLTFLAVYQFLAQYHDFIESVTLIRQQLERVIGDTGRWYSRLTGREMEVEADIAIEAPTVHAKHGVANEVPDANRHATAAPAGSVNSPLLPATTNDVRINIYTASLATVVFSCLTISLIIITLVTVTFSFYCQLVEVSGACQHIWRKIADWLAELLSLVLQ